MNELNTVLSCLLPNINATTYRHLEIIGKTMLAMTGRITMLSISRWTEKEISYRTITRFFSKKIDWSQIHWTIIKSNLKKNEGVYLLAGDATTVTKSGKKTFGLGKFFSSIYGRAVKSIAFQTLSLINVETRKSWPILLEQMKPKPKVTKSKPTKNKKEKRGRGRPKGSKNKNHRNVELNAEMQQVQTMLKKTLELIKGTIKVAYFVYDGAFGNNAAVQMSKQVGLHLISKLKKTSALYYEYSGDYSGKGRRKIYGKKINYDKLSDNNLISKNTDGDICTRIYQQIMLHKKFADKLNVVIILKENIKTGKQARIILFTTDLELNGEKIIDYYKLRFQIEFNFRDAKQHWGLEDFMVIKEASVNNAANLSMHMVNCSQIIQSSTQESILDLKARHHALRYAMEAFKILPQNPNEINIEQLFSQMPVLGRIHLDKMAV